MISPCIIIYLKAQLYVWAGGAGALTLLKIQLYLLLYYYISLSHLDSMCLLLYYYIEVLFIAP